MDSDQSNQNKHAMANPGQSPQEALTGLWQFVADQMTIASNNLNADGTLNKAGLDALGNAMHTAQDFTSPVHTDANFMPMEWHWVWPPWDKNVGLRHVSGEGSPEADWARIGLAIRLTMAAYLQSGAKCESGKRCLTAANFESEARRNIENYVFQHYNFVTLAPGANAIAEEAARQCALGNPAACKQ